MADPLDLFSAYMPLASTALGVAVVLGYPDVGRPGVVAPIAALAFEDDGVAVGNNALTPTLGRKRIGATTEETKAVLYVYLDNERALLAMAGVLRQLKRSQLTVTSGDGVYQIIYGSSKRGVFTGENRLLDHSLITEMVFTRS